MNRKNGSVSYPTARRTPAEVFHLLNRYGRIFFDVLFYKQRRVTTELGVLWRWVHAARFSILFPFGYSSCRIFLRNGVFCKITAWNKHILGAWTDDNARLRRNRFSDSGKNLSLYNCILCTKINSSLILKTYFSVSKSRINTSSTENVTEREVLLIAQMSLSLTSSLNSLTPGNRENFHVWPHETIRATLGT